MLFGRVATVGDEGNAMSTLGAANYARIAGWRTLVERTGALTAAQRDRWPLWTPVLFGTGIAIYFSLRFEPSLWWAAGTLGGFLGMVWVSWRAAFARAAFIALTLVAGGFFVAQQQTHRVAAPVLEKPIRAALVTGQVIQLERGRKGPRVVLDKPVVRWLAPEATPDRIRLRLRRGDSVGVGDRISILARLSPPPAPAMPGAYDFQRRAWFARLGGVGFALGHVKPAHDIASSGGVGTAAIQLAKLRQAMADRIRGSLPAESGAIAAALIVGDRSAIPDETVQALRDAGLAHLLAISGLHLGLVATILFFGVRLVLAIFEPVALRLPIKKIAAIAALVGAFIYLLLAGATVPTQRAFIMTGIVLFAVLMDRTALSLRLVAWAAMIVLVLAPEVLLSASFQMSFAAVVALVAVYEALREPLRDWVRGSGPGRKLLFYFIGVAISTIVAGAATGLIALHHFGRITQFGLVANLAAIPIASFWIMPWGVLAAALMPFGFEEIALVPMAWGIEWVVLVARTVAGWPGAVAAVPVLPQAGLAAIAMGGLWLCLWRGRIRLLGCLGIVAGLIFIPLTDRPDILVTGNGKLMAVRLADGTLSLTSGKTERFAAKIWMERDGQLEPRVWVAGSSASTPLSCDKLGCVYRRAGRHIALIKDARAFADDCRADWIVVSTVPARRACRGTARTIDRFDLWRQGAHAIWIGQDVVTVKSVRAVRGDRPWTARRP
jgi:competence protein ComEC